MTSGARPHSGWDTVFWPAVDSIAGLGLVERVGMLLDGDDAEGEIIHPYGIRGGESAERDLADAARAAAESTISGNQLGFAKGIGCPAG